ncbi:MAG TPA: hypothetical protein VJR25_09495 [Microbacterium sp.]|uniref:hypothetical protein n=1 Tax=Microbacterium sp. TaxID=51671 RepID=UPI002B4900FC|nr:hypothetical protein [Microbacterium sp.]HKT56995.1 hypothetical protein [Microbacterium sp.]
MSDGARAARLRDEVLRLANRNWDLRERTRFEAVMAYPLTPSGFEVIVTVIAGILTGSGAATVDYREVRIWVDEAGGIHRRTIGDLPPRRRRKGRAWEVPDTDGPGARTVFDEGPRQT